MRGGGLVRGRFGYERKMLAGLGFHLVGINKPIAAHPDVVTGFGQVWQNKAALIVGDDNFDEAHRQVAGFRNHPDAGFRPIGAAHHAADVVGINRHRLCAGGLCEGRT